MVTYKLHHEAKQKRKWMGEREWRKYATKIAKQLIRQTVHLKAFDIKIDNDWYGTVRIFWQRDNNWMSQMI